MATEKKPRKSPVPADPVRIMEGAIKMNLADKVKVRNALTEAIEAEIKAMEQDLADAKAMLTDYKKQMNDDLAMIKQFLSSDDPRSNNKP